MKTERRVLGAGIGLAALGAAGAAPAPLTAVQTSTAPAPAPTPQPGSLESSKIRLDAQDISGALADAQLVISKGGGADAFAARADARRAQGGPFEEVLADYSRAAKLDPRYLEKYNGLIAQRASEQHPQRIKGDTGLNGVPVAFIGLVVILGALSIAGAVLMLRRRQGVPAAPDDEAILPDGIERPLDAVHDDSEGRPGSGPA